MIDRKKWDRARAKVLATRDAREARLSALRVKYGAEMSLHWLSAAERGRVNVAIERYDKACDAFWALLMPSAPRAWFHGVPSAWVCEELTYADAVRPLSEQLSVVPPCAYGYSQPIR